MTNKPKLKVVYRKTDDLSPYENNARVHTQSQIDILKKSIAEFGFTNPILVDESDTVIAGHARLEAATQMEIAQVPTIVLQGLTEEQRAAYAIADNKITLNASWDFKTLEEEIEKLRETDLDLDLTGFTDIELQQFGDTAVDDPAQEWDGMPEFENEAAGAHRVIKVHIRDEEAERKFFDLVGVLPSESAKYMWFPSPPPAENIRKDGENVQEWVGSDDE